MHPPILSLASPLQATGGETLDRAPPAPPPNLPPLLVAPGGGRRQGCAAPVMGAAGSSSLAPTRGCREEGGRVAGMAFARGLVAGSPPVSPLFGPASPVRGCGGWWPGCAPPTVRIPWMQGGGLGRGVGRRQPGGGWWRRCCVLRSSAVWTAKGRRVQAWCGGRPIGPPASDLDRCYSSLRCSSHLPGLGLPPVVW